MAFRVSFYDDDICIAQNLGPGQAWRGPCDKVVHILLGEEAVEDHNEGAHADHLYAEPS